MQRMVLNVVHYSCVMCVRSSGMERFIVGRVFCNVPVAFSLASGSGRFVDLPCSDCVVFTASCQMTSFVRAPT